MMDCRAALVNADGNYESALKGLVDQGIAKAAKKAERAANEGLVSQYIHPGGKIGVLIEVNCETDFVARNDTFRELVRDIAMHVAAMPAQYVSRDQVPEADIAALRTKFAADASGKPAQVVERILEGKLNKWFEEHVLLDQPFVKDDDKSVGELIASRVGTLGENIRVRRFAKFALGEP